MNIFSFLWRVPREGFEWIDPDPAWPSDKERRYPERHRREWEKPHLVPVDKSEQVSWRKIRPLEDPALFRKFADLDADKREEIRLFANEFGQPLSEGQWVEVRAAGQNPTNGLNATDWFEQINPLKVATSLWEAARDEDTDRIREWIDFSRSVLRVSGRSMLWPALQRLDLTIEGIEMSTEADTAPLVNAARSVARGIANRCLDLEGVRPHLDFSADPGQLLMTVVPKTLLGACWIQFIDWVEGKRTYRRCEQCRSWFAVSLDTKRMDSIYCGDACRHKAYRLRRMEAWKLHQAGYKPGEIATGLNSDVRTVRGWIRAAKDAKRSRKTPRKARRR